MLEKAEITGAMADVMICLGSSMRVGIPADIVSSCALNGGKVIIVNLQKTPLDHEAHMNIHCRIQTVMKMLMEKLGIEIPHFTFDRGVDVWLDKTNKVRAQGVTRDATRFDNFRRFSCAYKPGAKL